MGETGGECCKYTLITWVESLNKGLCTLDWAVDMFAGIFLIDVVSPS